jgi:hypothetical protein
MKKIMLVAFLLGGCATPLTVEHGFTPDGQYHLWVAEMKGQRVEWREIGSTNTPQPLLQIVLTRDQQAAAWRAQAEAALKDEAARREATEKAFREWQEEQAKKPAPRKAKALKSPPVASSTATKDGGK